MLLEEVVAQPRAEVLAGGAGLGEQAVEEPLRPLRAVGFGQERAQTLGGGTLPATGGRQTMPSGSVRGSRAGVREIQARASADSSISSSDSAGQR